MGLLCFALVLSGCGYAGHALPGSSVRASFPRGALLDEGSTQTAEGLKMSWIGTDLGEGGRRVAIAVLPPDGALFEAGDHSANVIGTLKGVSSFEDCGLTKDEHVKAASREGRTLGFACPGYSMWLRVLAGQDGVFILVASSPFPVGIDEGPDDIFLRSLTERRPGKPQKVVAAPKLAKTDLEPFFARRI